VRSYWEARPSREDGDRNRLNAPLRPLRQRRRERDRAPLDRAGTHSLTEALACDLESPGTKAYTQPELERLFAPYARAEYRRYVTRYDRRVAGPLARLTGPRFGWFVAISATR